MISEYGFYISHNSYYGAGRGNADVRWSNFILEPIVHVKDDQNARRLFRMRNDKGEEAVIKLDQRSLVSFADFRIRTESKGNYIWEAGQGELTKLKNTCSTDSLGRRNQTARLAETAPNIRMGKRRNG